MHPCAAAGGDMAGCGACPLPAAIAAHYGRLRLAWGLHAATGLIMIIWLFLGLANWVELKGARAQGVETGVVTEPPNGTAWNQYAALRGA